MKTVQRYDRGALRSAVRTPEGYYLVEGFVARPGVLEYRNADGSIRRELVPPEELHRADSLETLARKPVTLEHPTRNDEAVFVGPDNVAEFETGDVDGEVEVERLNGFVKVRMAVRRQDAVSAIDQGIRELSPGYTVDLDPTPGVHPEFGPYDAIQKNRRYNHVAITRAGRAGASVALRADSAVQVTPFDAPPPPTRTYTMTDIQKTVQEELARRDAEDKAKKLEAENEELKKKIDELQGKLDAMKADMEEKGKEKTDSIADRLAWFEARQDALGVASAVGATVPENADVADIRRAVVAHRMGPNLRQDASDDYVAAAYDIIRQQAGEQKRQDAYDTIGKGLSQPAQQPAPVFQPFPGQPQHQQPRQDTTAPAPEDAFRAHLDKAWRKN